MNTTTSFVLPSPVATVPFPIWMGIDVAKDSFDAAVAVFGMRAPAPVKTFARTEPGVRECLAWAHALLEEPQRPLLRAVMEATGKYSLELAVWLTAQCPSLQPAIVNPRHAKHFAESLGVTDRSDKADARSLARMGLERQPAPLAPPDGHQLELREMTRYRQFLVEQRQAEANRAAESQASRVVKKMQAQRIRQLDRQIEKLEEDLYAHVSRSSELERDARHLDSIFGVGMLTAVTVLAELGDLRRFHQARQLTAFAGLSLVKHTSGSSVRKKTHMSKRGSAHVRRILYTSAMTAIRGDNDFAEVYHRLLAHGKNHMTAIGAVMRKLLVTMRAVLISGQPYAPHYTKLATACG